MLQYISTRLFIISLFLIITNNLVAQQDLESKIQLTKIDTAKFNSFVRISYVGYYLDVWENKSGLCNGEITQFCEWTYKKVDTLFKKYPISPEKAQAIIALTQKNEIINLKDDKELYPNELILDGYPYVIKILQNKKYYIKKYELYPTHDTAIELQITKYKDTISKIVRQDLYYNDFNSTLPLKGSFSRFSSEIMVRLKGAKTIGYEFSNYTPYGICFSKYFISTLKKHIDTGIRLKYSTDFKKNNEYYVFIHSPYPFNLKKDSIHNYSFSYAYRYRSFSQLMFPVHTIGFSTWYKVLWGIDLKISQRAKLGILTGYSYYFVNSKIDISSNIKIYINEIDWTASLNKDIKVLHRYFTIGIVYERFSGLNIGNCRLETIF